MFGYLVFIEIDLKYSLGLHLMQKSLK